jgi:hypothetical protein
MSPGLTEHAFGTTAFSLRSCLQEATPIPLVVRSLGGWSRFKS